MSEHRPEYSTPGPLRQEAGDWAALGKDSTMLPGRNGSGPEEHAAPRFTPLTADSVTALPPVSWLLRGEIPRVGLSVLYGASGGGKSFLALDMALRIAQEHPVIYVAAEGAAGYAARLLAWKRHHGQPLGALYFVDRAVNLLDPRDVDAFLAAILPLRPALVVIDTLARCMLGGEENGSRDMGLAVEAGDRIKRVIGPDGAGGAVLFVHHATKAGTTERGSGALKAGSDHMLRLDSDDGLLTVSCEKTKDAAYADTRYLRLLPVETGRQTEEGQPETSCAVISADRVIMAGTVTPSARKVLEALSQATFEHAGARASQLIGITDVRERTFYACMSSLLRDGFATQDAKGEPYRITDKGKEQLQ